MKCSTKRLISILVCLALVLAVLPMAAMAEDSIRVYCQAPASWTVCSAYWWGSSSDPSWPGVPMSQDSSGIWYIDIPAGATNLIFNDGKASGAAQTKDLTMPADDKVMYVFENSYWTTYGVVEVVTEYFVAGASALCGVNWDPGYAANKMTDSDEDGIFSISFAGIAKGDHEMKVTTGSWNGVDWGGDGPGGNYVVKVEQDNSTVVVYFDSVNGVISSEVTAPGGDSGETLIHEGSVTYETSDDVWNNPFRVSFIPVADGEVTIDITACDPGFGVEVRLDDELIEEYYGSAAQQIKVPVTAGKLYEFDILSAIIYAPTLTDKMEGSVSYKITANVAAGELTPDDEGGDDTGAGSSQENPQPISSFYGNYIKKGETVWFVFDNTEDMKNNGEYSQILSISCKTPYAVTYREMDVPVDADGYVNYEMYDMSKQGKYVFSVTNNGSQENAFFTIEVKDPANFIISETALDLGDNDVTCDSGFEHTLYEFTPAKVGVYTFTAAEGTLGNWGTIFNPVDNTTDKKATLEWTCTAEGQSILVGLTGTEVTVINVAKTGEYVENKEPDWIDYENTYDFSTTVNEGVELIKIDVLDEKEDVAVLDKNGFYRYGSANGPLMVTDLNEHPVNLSDALLNGQLRAYVYDKNGELVERIDYNLAFEEYLDAGLTPVTEELARMVQQVGTHHQWWRAEGPVFEAEAPENTDNAWMTFCSYIKGSEVNPDAEDDGTNNGTTNNNGTNNGGTNNGGTNNGGTNNGGTNNGGTNNGGTNNGGTNNGGTNNGTTNNGTTNNGKDNNPKTGDISLAWAVIAMALAGCGLVIMKKKESFFVR